jgi:anti-sigma-K factor RskA
MNRSMPRVWGGCRPGTASHDVAAGPRPLGLIAEGALSVDLGPLAARALASGVLAVSLEPAGGSPTGSPTGPVLYQGRILAAPTP